MPLLAPGRCYVQGRPSHVVRRGTLGHAVIPALRSYEEVTLGDIPAAVFPDRRSRRSAQPIYRYRTPEGALFIPPQELIRRLFLHDKTLAHALLRPGGLWELARYENPGFHDKFTLHFTAAMPLGVPTRAPSSASSPGSQSIPPVGAPGRASLASLLRMVCSASNRRRSSIPNGVSAGFSGAARPWFWNCIAPAESAIPAGTSASHTLPARWRRERHVASEWQMPEDPGKGIVAGRIEKDFVVEDAASRQNVRQDVLAIDRALSDFDDTGPRIARRRQRPDPALDAPAAGQLQRGSWPRFRRRTLWRRSAGAPTVGTGEHLRHFHGGRASAASLQAPRTRPGWRRRSGPRPRAGSAGREPRPSPGRGRSGRHDRCPW